MFVWSIKGKTLKFAGIVCLAAVLMITLLVLVPKSPAAEAEETAAQATASYSFDKVKSNSDRVKFLEQFGWEVEKSPAKECVVAIPKDFNSLMSSYNALQKELGLDLENYSGREAMRYTYKITNYPGAEGDVFANIMTYKNSVIAGDVCSAEGGGFISSLLFPEDVTPETEASEAETPETEAPES